MKCSFHIVDVTFDLVDLLFVAQNTVVLQTINLALRVHPQVTKVGVGLEAEAGAFP